MRNIVWLYDNDECFREAVCQAAADWLGSTSLNFAGAWLMEQHKYEHHDSDYEDLKGQHLDGPCVVPDRFCSDAAKLLIGQFVAQETGETAESDAAKSEMRDFDDSREKLEADIRNYQWKHGETSGRVAEWLDRQAAITAHMYEDEVNRCNRAMNEAAGKWAKADARNRELSKMLMLDDGTVEDYTERLDLQKALDYQKQLADEYHEDWREIRAHCDELEAFAKRLEEAAKNGDDVTLFDVDYAPIVDAEYLESWDSASVADLLHQYEDGKLMRECDMETHVLIETEELRSIAEKYRADAIAAQDERDAYRELCGKMRLLANEIALMEVD